MGGGATVKGKHNMLSMCEKNWRGGKVKKYVLPLLPPIFSGFSPRQTCAYACHPRTFACCPRKAPMFWSKFFHAMVTHILINVFLTNFFPKS